jgi:hypothetical protein
LNLDVVDRGSIVVRAKITATLGDRDSDIYIYQVNKKRLEWGLQKAQKGACAKPEATMAMLPLSSSSC